MQTGDGFHLIEKFLLGTAGLCLPILLAHDAQILVAFV